MKGTYLLCRDCGHICETADAPNTDSGSYDPCCPDCHHNWMVDPVTEIERLEAEVRRVEEYKDAVAHVSWETHAENKRLREHIEELKEAKLKVDDDLVELYARYKRLREALERIAEETGGMTSPSFIEDIARKALGDE